MPGEAILIVVVMAGQAILKADAMAMTWERCSELVVQFNAPDGREDGVFTDAFCTDADTLSIRGIYLENPQ